MRHRQQRLADASLEVDFDGTEFLQLYHLTRPLFMKILSRISLYLGVDPRNFRRDAVYPHEAFALFLYSVGSRSEARKVGLTFGRSEDTVRQQVDRVARVIVEHLVPQVITLPSETEIKRSAAQIEAEYGFVGCFGALDGTHLPLK